MSRSAGRAGQLYSCSYGTQSGVSIRVGVD